MGYQKRRPAVSGRPSPGEGGSTTFFETRVADKNCSLAAPVVQIQLTCKQFQQQNTPGCSLNTPKQSLCNRF